MNTSRLTLRNISLWLLPLFAGALLAASFAPYDNSFLVWPALLGLLYSTHQTPGFRCGMLFGVSYFSVGLSWITHSIHYYGNTSLGLALFLMMLFIAFLALFPACQTWLMAQLNPHRHPALKSLTFACLWTLLEVTRSILFSGFPWLLLGYSQVNSWLAPWGPLVGVYGLGFLVSFSSALIFYGFIESKSRRFFSLALGGLMLSLLLAKALTYYNAPAPDGPPIAVSLVQGNISQSIKWSPQHNQSVIQQYQQLSHNHWDHRLVVWPETAIPIEKARVTPWLDTLALHARAQHSTLITGIPIFNLHSQGYYNSLIAIGESTGRYNKAHLVPFGEYTPLSQFIRPLIQRLHIPMSDLLSGSKQQALLNIQGLQIAPFICYEIAFSSQVFAALPKAKLLLVLSDDSWFGHSNASAQHLQIAQMRALETGRPILFVSNGGITAIITPQGRIAAHTPYFKAAVLDGEVQPFSGKTPLIYLGQPTLFTLLLLLWLCLAREDRALLIKVVLSWKK